MERKVFSLAAAFFMLFALSVPSSYAVGAKEAAASLLLPTTGQSMNDQLGTTKSKIMAGVEVAAVTTVAILGGVVGGGVVWAGLGPLIANHLWSATDAYKGAQSKYERMMRQQLQMMEAQRTLELSRQRRFEREQATRTDIRQKIAMAGEQPY